MPSSFSAAASGLAIAIGAYAASVMQAEACFIKFYRVVGASSVTLAGIITSPNWIGTKHTVEMGGRIDQSKSELRSIPQIKALELVNVTNIQKSDAICRKKANILSRHKLNKNVGKVTYELDGCKKGTRLTATDIKKYCNIVHVIRESK